MIVSWLVLLFILPFIGIRFHFNDMDGFMDVDQTTSIKGFFAALIFLSHVHAYLTIAPDSVDSVFSVIIGGIGQRIPMMILDKADVSDNMLFILISLTMTICLSAGFERIVRAVDRRLFRRNVAL